MDEVQLTFNLMIRVSHAVEKKATSTVVRRSAFTVVLGCHANGRELPPGVVFKRKTPREEKFPVWVINANQKDWMLEEKMKERLSEVYVRRPDVVFFFPKHRHPWWSVTPHLTAAVKKKEQE